MISKRTAMILLVGEQPAPNLLPARHLQPDAVGLVYTTRTERVAKNLEGLLSPDMVCHRCPVHPYSLDDIQRNLKALIFEKFGEHDLCFNLTGGTKPMALAAFQIARIMGCPFVYFQSEGNKSKLFRYAFVKGSDDEITSVEPQVIPTSISLDDYLRMYLGTYTRGEPREPFESVIRDVLQSTTGINEVFTSLRPQGMGALEVDFVIRCGNQIGVGEVKSQGNKKAIDQLNGVAQQRYLGTYIRKFLISSKPVDYNNQELAEAYRTKVIELLSYGETGEISLADKQKLSEKVLAGMGVVA